MAAEREEEPLFCGNCRVVQAVAWRRSQDGERIVCAAENLRAT